MRVDFVKAVEAALDADPASLFITGDLGFNALEGIAARFGPRFVNAGVAEQNMMGLAAGAALMGRKPWVYSIAPFVTYRCLEQIRNDVCLHALPVRIAGNGGGYTYGVMGSTHHALEDLAVLKVMPNMQLFFPCANDHVAAAVRIMAALAGPAYLRLAISAYATDRAPLAEHPTTLTRTYARRADPAGRGVTVIGAGHGVQVALRALATNGPDTENADVFGVARFPFDLAADAELLASARATRNVVFVEEHYAAGGMGESMQRALPPLDSFTLLAAAYRPDQRYGSPAFHMQQCALTPEALVEAVRRAGGGVVKKLSAIVACYKDEQAIPIMAERLAATFQKLDVDYEIIFVNDGSPDDTQTVLERLTAANPRIKAITHSRNFGSQNAFTSGMARATGDACILLDGDLQDPPELIEAFHAKWLEGYDVVYGVRTRREMPRLLEFGYKGFYRLFQRMAYIRVPVDAGDFSLIDRKVMNILNELPERDRFVRGLRAWTGFRQMGVPYVRPERMFGRSTNNLLANLRWAKKGIFSFSYVPLELISFGALAVSLLAALAAVLQIVGRIVQPNVPRGFSTVIVISLFLGSINLVSLAFIAEYIGKIFEEVKQRPKFIVAKTLNLDEVPAPSSAPPALPPPRRS